jgi:hypothetical protein
MKKPALTKEERGAEIAMLEKEIRTVPEDLKNSWINGTDAVTLAEKEKNRKARHARLRRRLNLLKREE